MIVNGYTLGIANGPIQVRARPRPIQLTSPVTKKG
jgi:hypothetical protein